MTFASMNENNNSIVNESFVLKVSYGTEFRRTSFAGITSFEALRELVAKLFNLEQASILLKYQDEDNDKITMLSDDEFQCALRLTKERLLRLFIEMKANDPATKEKPSLVLPLGRLPCGPHIGHSTHGPKGPIAFPLGRLSHCPRVGHVHRHHAPPSPSHVPCEPHTPHPAPHEFHAHRRHGPHGHHHGPHDLHAHRHYGPHSVHRGPHAHHHGPRTFPQRGGVYGFHGPFSIRSVETSNPTSFSSLPEYTGEVNFSVPSMVAHGTFSPASSLPTYEEKQGPSPSSSSEPEKPISSASFSSSSSSESEKPLLPHKCILKKEARRLLREDRKSMKANDTITEEDKEAINAARQQMRTRWMERKLGMIARLEKKCKDNKNNENNNNCENNNENKNEDNKENKKRGERLMAHRVMDITIPDNSVLPADTPVTKTWRLKNVGSNAWPESSQLILNRRFGDSLNGPERIKVGKVEREKEIDVSVSFITPEKPGKYVSVYRMENGDGRKFGQRVWVSFIIPEPIVQATA